MSLLSAISSFRANLFDPTAKNSMSVPLGQEFLRYGNRNTITPDWAQVVMSDKDLYTGYMYGALTKRARRAAQIAVDAVKTKANEATTKAATAKKVPLIHPYSTVIEDSPTFSDNAFWHDITTFLDLEGVYYLYVLRTVGEKKVGNPQEFKLLNPYFITRVKDKDNLQVQGYIERRNGFIREIPKQQIIEIRDLNPFSDEDPFSMADAAKDSMFTLKQAGDFTRSSLKHNMKSSGIVSTDLILTPEQMVNFKARLMGGNKGEPIFTDGAGGVKYSDMQIALDKAALKDVTTMNVESTLVTTGTSKTILGIEVSGVTRDTSETQSELFVTGEIMPRLQVILDALNQDYRNSYPEEFKKFGYKFFLDSPLGADREAELQDVNIRNESYNLYTSLIDAGYKREMAADFAAVKIDLLALGLPTETPKTITPSPDTVTLRETPPADAKPADTPAANALATVNNELDTSALNSQEAGLQSAIMQIEARVASAVAKKVTNAYDSQSDVITDKDRQENEHDLETALLLFYMALLPLQAASVMRQRMKEFGKAANFTMTPAVQQAIKDASGRAASSHMDTILQDFLEAVQVAVIVGGDTSAVVEAVKQAYPEESAQVITDNLRAAAEKASRDGGKEAERLRSVAATLNSKYKDSAFDDLLAGVRMAALAGANQTELQAAIRKEYADISKTRAKVIAKSETSRAFSMSQFQADTQFLTQNDLMGQAYKKWICRGPNPCVYCLAKQAEGKIPFENAFVKIGDTVTARSTKENGTITVHAYQITYETVYAGDIHPNGNCSYELILE